ncbi:Crp/Fnr family transcriptional regulator [Hydrogenophaga bisanensis]|jgi:CRP-like cAMP-binding protein|uniref:Crp/Fnr family transcriptional regulator n=1 Tax=Hydrogenophaga bisanensis TaxID=439611 RepID=A0ABW2RB64_9BURK
MSAPTVSVRFNIQDLAQAMAHSHALDALPLNLNAEQWKVLADFLQPLQLQEGQKLMEQGIKDRTVYFVESGTLTVHYEDAKERIRLAMVGPGSVLGEGAFYSHLPRSATVTATNVCRLWCLTPLRYRELASRHPDVALELTMAMSAVLARRLYNRPKRVAVT